MLLRGMLFYSKVGNVTGRKHWRTRNRWNRSLRVDPSTRIRHFLSKRAERFLTLGGKIAEVIDTADDGILRAQKRSLNGSSDD